MLAKVAVGREVVPLEHVADRAGYEDSRNPGLIVGNDSDPPSNPENPKHPIWGAPACISKFFNPAIRCHPCI
jgi:hypothetical protein